MKRPGPKITVVIAVRNAAATLQRALDSVFEQTYREVELIVIDGASTDGTARIIANSGPQIAYWESRPDRGIYHAWNKGLDHATGDWIYFLGADDRLHAPDVLAKMASSLATASQHQRVVYAAVRVVDSTGSTRGFVGAPWSDVREDFRKRMSIPHQATMHHRSLFDDHGRFDEAYRICGDYEFLLRELLEYDPLFVPGVIVADMGMGGLSSRRTTAITMTREFHHARHTHGLERAPAWRSFAVLRAQGRAWLDHIFGQRVADAVAHVYRLIVRRPDGGAPR